MPDTLFYKKLHSDMLGLFYWAEKCSIMYKEYILRWEVING